MKNKPLRLLTLASFLLTGWLLTSCGEDEVTDTQIGLKFNTVKTPANLRSTLAFNSGHIVLGEIDFELETDDDSLEIDFNLEAITIIDFATGETTPDISFVEIPVGTYNEVEVSIELKGDDDNPSIVLNGTYVDQDGVSHDIRFELDSDESFEVEKEGVITFEANESVLAQVTIDPTAWFAGVTAAQLSAAKKDDKGVIVISSNQNSDIFDLVEDGLDLATDVEIEKD